MSTELIIAIITSMVTLAGVIITGVANSKNTSKQLKVQNDLTLYRIQQLEKKVEKHNNLIERTYRLEETVSDHEKEIEDLKRIRA